MNARGSWIPLLLVLAAAASAQAQGTPGLPLHVSADRMTGTHGPDGDEVILSGDVQIRRGRTLLTAEEGRYLRGQRVVYLQGGVEMVDSSTTVTCERASYSEDRDVVELSGDVTLEDGDATLSAPAATYDRRIGRADLYGGVEGTDREQSLTCDRAIYFRDTRQIQARGNVRGVDEKNRLELSASSIDFDRITREALAEGDPTLTVKDEKGSETVIRALRLRLNTETRVAEAIDSVSVVRDTLRARADYGLFDDRAERGWLLGHPRAWDEETTVSGDTLEMWTDDRALKRVVVRSGAAVDYRGMRSDNRGETSRLTGETIDVFFTDEEIDSLVSVGKARNHYQGVAAAGKTPESNLAVGDTITVFFRKGEIERARVRGNAEGEYQLAVDVGDSLAYEEERVRYDASNISYEVRDNKIILEQSARMTYGELELTAGRVEYDVDRQTVVARGSPELVEEGDRVGGHLMTYDLESRVGNIYSAETTYEKGLYHGERIRKATDNELDVLNGRYSTCDRENPHYHFSAHWMKIYLKNKLVAKPVVFYVGKVPLLALPFWIFPIKPGRHSGFLFPQIEFGFTNRAGQFIRNAGYYWAPNDYMDLTVSGDYYQFEPSWIIRAEGVYKLLYVLDGSVRGSFARNERAGNEEWDLNADHSQEVTPRTRLIARGAFVSSRNFNSSNLFGRSLSQRLNRFLNSSLAISHIADWATFNAILDRRQDLDADEAIKDPDGDDGPLQGPPPGTAASLPNLTQTLPTLSVSFPTRAIGSLGLLRNTPLAQPLASMYFSLGTRFVSQHEQRAVVAAYQGFLRDSVPDSTTVLDQRVTRRWGAAANTSLSDARRLSGWLNLSPSFSGSFALFDFDEQGNKMVPAATWSTALTTSTTLYGTFYPRLGMLNGIRHVVAPSASFFYSPEFRGLTFTDSLRVRRNRFRSFGGIGVSGFKQFLMNFGLDQRLQVKLQRRDQVQKLDNLLSWSLRGSYNFLYQQQGLRHPLSPLSSNVFLQPPGFVSGNLSWVTDLYHPRPVRSLSYNVGMSLSSGALKRREAVPSLPLDESSDDFDEEDLYEGNLSRDQWMIDLAYSYSGGYDLSTRWSSSQTGNLVFRYQITPGWGFDYSASYDVTNREVGTQRFALTRDLHCWQAIFSRTFAPDGEAEYYFRLGVKEQREIYLERGTRSGSIGGIQ